MHIAEEGVSIDLQCICFRDIFPGIEIFCIPMERVAFVLFDLDMIKAPFIQEQGCIGWQVDTSSTILELDTIYLFILITDILF